MAIVKIDEWVANNGMSLDVISEPEPMAYPYPKTIDDVGNLFSDILFKPPRRSSNRLYCAKLKDFYVFSDGGVFDSTLKNQIEGFNGKVILQNNILIENTAIDLTSRWGATNYWHWMAESLARLSLAQYPYKYEDVTYIVNSLKNSFVTDSLRVMRIDLKKCVEIDKFKCVKCRNLFLPSKIGDFDKSGLMFLREKIRGNVHRDKKSPERIYISRKTTRVVENEAEVMELLCQYGFYLIECEKLTFKDQVKTFYNAEVVVAPHGAGNTNLLFAKDNAKFLELRSPKYFGRTYYYLCNHLGFDYYSLYGKGKIPTTPEEAGASLQSNMNIDIERLRKSLDYMGVI